MKNKNSIIRLIAMVLLLAIFATGCAETEEPLPTPDEIIAENTGDIGDVNPEVDTETPKNEDEAENDDITEPETKTEDGGTTPPVNTETPDENEEKEPEQIVITADTVTEISFEFIINMDAISKIHKIDLINNKIYMRDFIPFYERNADNLSEKILASDLYKNNGIYFEIKTFTEAEEKVFLETLKNNGFFETEEFYEEIGYDGFSWNLDIKYGDGDVKHSGGCNLFPEEIFNACAPAFYDLCGTDVLKSLPFDFLTPPNFSVLKFDLHRDESDRVSYTAGRLSTILMDNIAACYWSEGRVTVEGTDLYELNQGYRRFKEMYSGAMGNCIYNVTGIELHFIVNYPDRKLYASEPFTKLIVKSYDYNKELTNEAVVLESDYFEYSTAVELEVNKIYTFELQFEDGDFVRYTFNTKI